MIHGPVRKDGAPVNEPAGDWTENARIVGADAMIAHHEIFVLVHAHRPKVAQVLVLRRDIRLRHYLSFDVDGALPALYGLTRQADHALNGGFRMIEGIPEHDHITALNWLEAVDKIVDENAFLVGEQRRHAGAFDLHRLVQEDDDDQGQPNGNEQVAGPNANFVAKGVQRHQALSRRG